MKLIKITEQLKIKIKLNYSKNSNSSKIECLNQNQPEGISMAVPMKNGGMSIAKVIFYVILSGVTTGIGAFFGAIVGQISQGIIAICLSFAARSNVIYSIAENSYQNLTNYIMEKLRQQVI